jgi:energy-coupling factor transport system substrate-specific component
MRELDVQSLVRQIELKDLSTAAHTWRVVLYTRAVAERLAVDHALMPRITHAAALHDVGKLDIPDSILQKPGKLTDDEFAVIKSHTTRGYDRLKALGETDEAVLNFVRHHHERWDGKGYPDALAGEAIPLGPRFFAVIDSFDAMTSIRPYRMEIDDAAVRRAIEELRAGRATRYWPDAVDVFTELYETGELDWIHEHFNDRCELPAYSADAAPPRR